MALDLSQGVILKAPKSEDDGMPVLALEGLGVSNKFVVLPDLNEPRFFVGLVIDEDKVQPLAFTKTFADALGVLHAIVTGFLAVGFNVHTATINPDTEEK